MIKTEDIDGFFATSESLNLENYLLFDYIFETSLDPRLTAASLCSEQSTAQWRRQGSDEDLRIRFGAKTLSLEIMGKVDGLTQCRVRIAHPHTNFGPRIPNILSAMAGEGAFYCPGIKSLRIVDIHFPNSFLKNFEGPRLGVDGLRISLNVQDRPFFIGVVKPNIGLSPKDFAQLAYQSWLGGLDIAKDDEMLANIEWSPLKQRMEESGRLKLLAEKETGKPKMILANLTDEIDVIGELYQESKMAGANGVMLNSFFVGFSALRALRKISDLPLFGHFTGQAIFDRAKDHGIDGVVLVKLQRLAGCDAIIMPGFGERMHASDESVLKNVKACLDPMGSLLPSLPIPGGSDWAGTLPLLFEKIGHADFGFISGRGVFNHPSGPKAGAESLHEAWEAIIKKISLEEYAKNHQSLREAMDAFR